jgi:hypothetical protein
MRKWNWLFVNGLERKIPIYKAMEFLKIVPRWNKCITVFKTSNTPVKEMSDI